MKIKTIWTSSKRIARCSFLAWFWPYIFCRTVFSVLNSLIVTPTWYFAFSLFVHSHASCIPQTFGFEFHLRSLPCAFSRKLAFVSFVLVAPSFIFFLLQTQLGRNSYERLYFWLSVWTATLSFIRNTIALLNCYLIRTEWCIFCAVFGTIYIFLELSSPLSFLDFL